ncbi:MAG: hypothetical protein ABSC15_15395 [Terriglobales bacterium]
MTCEEFKRVLPELGSGHGIEQEEHLRSCCACSDLVADLNAISKEARFLKGSEDPSPWVWNSIEVALRQEGLIRQPQLQHLQTPAPMLGWRLRWLVPLAATLLIVFGALIYQRGTGQPQTPSMRATYEADLRSVNAYIRDAEQSAHSDPNDEVAQQYLRNAYEQKAMVYEMALDRSLP